MQIEYIRTIKYNKRAPKVSISVPMYQAKYIGWVSMEAISRQNTTVPWEVIIAEEQAEDCMPFGFEEIDKYIKRGKACVGLTYIAIKDWVPLSTKMVTIINNCDKRSQYILWTGCDMYMAPNTIKRYMQIMRQHQNIDWIMQGKNTMYRLRDGKQRLISIGRRSDGCFNFTRMELAKKIPMTEIIKGIDGYIFKHCEIANGGNLTVFVNEDDCWKHSFNTHGINTISPGVKRDKRFDGHYIDERWSVSSIDICKNIPKTVIKKLKDTAKYVGKYNKEAITPKQRILQRRVK